MYGKPKEDNWAAVPGPGTYRPKSMLKVTGGTMHKTGRGSNLLEVERSKMPGPSAYNFSWEIKIKKHSVSNLSRAPKTTAISQIGPGPAAYEVKKIQKINGGAFTSSTR